MAVASLNRAILRAAPRGFKAQSVRITDLKQHQAAGRRQGARLRKVTAAKDLFKRRHVQSPPRQVDLHPDHAPHHMVEKGVAFHPVTQQLAAPQGFLRPAGPRDLAHGIVALRRLTEGPEIVFADQQRRRPLQRIDFQFIKHLPGALPPEGLSRPDIDDAVLVNSRERIEARVKVRPGLSQGLQGDVYRKQGIERAQQLQLAVAPGQVKGDHLSAGVHATVGAAAGEYGDWLARKLLKRRLYGALNGRRAGLLTLETGVGAAVVGQRRPVTQPQSSSRSTSSSITMGALSPLRGPRR